MKDGLRKTLLVAIEKEKDSIRAKVEHPFTWLRISLATRRYAKDLAKYQAQLFSLFGLVNLVMATRCKGSAGGLSTS